MTIKVFVGTVDLHHEAEKALEYSIRKNTKEDVDLTFMDPGWYVPPTGFSSHRFMIPRLCNYEGYAIHLDVDMLVLGDLSELMEYKTPGRWCVTFKHPRRGYRDEVAVIDCSAFKDIPPDSVLKQNHGKFQAKAVIGDRYLCNIPRDWNMLDRFDENTKLIHLTNLASQPWHPGANPGGDPTAVYSEHIDPSVVKLFWDYCKEAKEANINTVRPATECREGFYREF